MDVEENNPEAPSRLQPATLTVELLPAINAALWHNHIPALTGLSIQNNTDETVADVVIDLVAEPPALRPRSWRLAQVSPRQVRTLSDLDVQLDGAFLSSLTEGIRGRVSLVARVDNRLVAEQRQEVRFLAHNEWGGASVIPDILAAFVEPNDPLVPSILHKASDLLRGQSKADGLEGYQSGNKTRVWEQAAAIWSAVCARDIRYVNPPPSFEQTGQRIRSPHQSLGEKLATCLDLTVLFAACFEHIGLRPLMVLTGGHAFAGVWLSRHDFGSSVAEDAPGLRTRLALDDLILFETTLCTQGHRASGFRHACNIGASHVTAEKEAEFEKVIDIHRARQRRILPLAAHTGGYGRGLAPKAEPEVLGPPPIEEAPPLRDDPEASDDQVPDTPAGRLAHWQKRLLDLSSRNRLLNLKTGGKQAVTIDCPEPAKLENMLADMRGKSRASPFRFRPWPDLMGGADPRSAKLYRDRLQEDANQVYAREALAKRELLVARDDANLQATLTEIYRAARAAQQEGGSNTLYLTVGMLLWRQRGKDKPYRAPLILVPVVLERPSVRSGFVLRAHDDETRLNSTLLEMLRLEIAMRFPTLEAEPPAKDAGVDVETILDTFRVKLRDVSGWEVTNEVTLTNLSFAKYLMWKDLAERADLLRESEVARRLIDGAEAEPEREPPAVAPTDAGADSDLDEAFARAELICPLEADSSQLRAVVAAHRGESFVLIGPPGTGKSQTIANIVAHALGQGRSVLFVAEKRAALEVVQRRLHEVELDTFCLDLFSAKASKMAVLEQLNRAQQVRESDSEQDWRDATEGIAALRDELNGYVRELHRRARNGWTPFWAIGTVLRADTGGIPAIALSWPGAETHDAGDYQRLVEAVEDAAATLTRLGEITSAAGLRGIERSDWSPVWQAQLLEAARHAATALAALPDAAQGAARSLNLPTPPSLARPALAALDALAEVMSEPIAAEASWALSESTTETLDSTRAAAVRASRYRELQGRLFSSWGPDVMKLPLVEIRSAWRQASERWLFARVRIRRKLRKQLLPAVKGKLPTDLGPELSTLCEMQAQVTAIELAGQTLGPILGKWWKGLETDFAALEAAGDWARRVRAALAGCADDPVQHLAVRDHVRRLAGDGADMLAPIGAVGAALCRFRDAWTTATSSIAALTPLCGSDPNPILTDHREDWATSLAAHLAGWSNHANRLRDWCAWRGIVQQLGAIGLARLVDAMEQGIVGAGDAVRVFEANYARWWLDLAVDAAPRLRGFVVAQHETRIKRFRELDKRLLQLASRLVRARLASGIPSVPARQTSPEYTLLAHELAKRQRHLPVRQLIGRIPQALRRLTPCLMMSPLSVAQYLPADAAPFDLVIFDEASQIPTWDAIGAIGRGRQVIVVGDPKQLPPTRFFERQLPDGDQNDAGASVVTTEDLESILDECLGANILHIELSWHYRSRHESLIAFSNHLYYGGRLITFPSPVTRDTAVSYRHVVGAAYERSGSRTNQAEARAVVAEIVRRLRAMTNGVPEKSIGVVTFNAEQQTLIENLLDEARRDDPAIERFFSDELTEPVLVKNLEGIQGEERDIVFFSLTYGPDQSGKLTMNFGPLNQAGGERRLNVAVTRARESLIVFGAMRADNIDLSRTPATGVAHLKRFLAYAEHGPSAFMMTATGPLGGFESPFEAAVEERLRQRGWVLHPQIGVSGYRIDLAVVNPEAPGEYLAGIECDGATYHRSATARDRDRLRQAVLQGLGWTLLRIWSTDWWTNAVRETSRLHSTLERLHAETKEVRMQQQQEPQRGRRQEGSLEGAEDSPLEITEVNDLPIVASTVTVPEIDGAAIPASTTTEIKAEADPARFYDDDYGRTLSDIISAILRIEGPIREDRLVQRVARAHGFQRAGREIRDRVLAALPRNCARTKDDWTFYWPPGLSPSAWNRFRDPVPGGIRDPTEVPIQELTVLARRVMRSVDGDEAALIAMRDACGMQRLRDQARGRCLAALDRARRA